MFCDGRRYCTQMRSKEEAIFFIQNCPNTKMDGDNDGDPSENDSRFGKKEYINKI
ncbi:excalibur calcium-binding domain-containing protein [Pectobacterium versatile]|uniref:excalibur calcium-binding domain-containing protein n=1 Tax=Pectobacterium versatile TaxID=2488639 RepID=UPI0022784E71|nr:excalibur calcium-binding domain-containing protein [Pectobacterium versatile]